MVMSDHDAHTSTNKGDDARSLSLGTVMHPHVADAFSAKYHTLVVPNHCLRKAVP